MPAPASTAPVPAPRLFPVCSYTWRELGRRLWPYLQPFRWRMLAALTLVAGVGMAVAAGPMSTKYVIDQGRLVEDGTFATLMNRDGLFRHLNTIDEPGVTPAL